METASELMDRIGPRLTGSPQMKEANEWTKDQLASWGLSNAHLESWGPFGRGWTWEGCTVRMTAPSATQLVAIPEAWTAGTAGPIRAAAARLNIKDASELEKLKGQFAGKIVFFGEIAGHRSAGEARRAALRRAGARGGVPATRCRAARRATTAPSTRNAASCARR